jgi:hypothetical protein
MTNSTNNARKRSCCTSHTFWTWLLAILLAIYLFWHWQHGHGPAHAAECCTGANTSTIISDLEPATAPNDTFNFTASNAHGYNATGDASNVDWPAKSATDLKAWFKGGADWVITGDAKNVTLTGNVESEDIKKAKGDEAQVFFGTNVTINNQLTVKVPEAVSITAKTPAAKDLPPL